MAISRAKSALFVAFICNYLRMGSTFLYFAYGSNLLAQRIHINNPSAVRVGTGKLENYRLDFLTYSKGWRGAAATIVKQPGAHVWGALWEINIKDLEHLDRQEGVHENLYFRFNTTVILPDGSTKECYVYQQCKSPPNIESIRHLPDERKPSAVYLKIMLEGARESGLPEDYIAFMRQIPHNGYNGDVGIPINLNRI